MLPMTSGLLIFCVVLFQTIKFADLGDVVPLSGDAKPPQVMKHPESRRYRTVIRENAKFGQNFAGHFTLVRLGCGTGCTKIAVVDASDGSVYFPHNLGYVHVADWWNDPIGLSFELSSSLAVVFGRAGSEDAPCSVSYFKWNRTDFILIRFEPHDCGHFEEPRNDA